MRKFRKLYLLAAAATFLLGVSTFQAARIIASFVERSTSVSSTLIAPVADYLVEEQNVYRAVMTHDFGRTNQQVVVNDATIKNHFEEGEDLDVLPGEAGLAADTITDYRVKNRTSSQLTSPDLDTKLVSQNAVESFFGERGSGWQGFHKAYPDAHGLLTFSRVGFNQSGDQALVYVAFSCGGLCGEGRYFVLKKSGSIWVINKIIPLWVS